MNAKDQDNRNVLMRAALNDRADIIEFLISSYNADISMIDVNSMNALAIAKMSGSHDCIRVLEKFIISQVASIFLVWKGVYPINIFILFLLLFNMSYHYYYYNYI